MARQSGVYRGVSAVDRAAERRARLLEATLTVWARAGAEGARVTMTAVCAEARLTERYFYESFAGLNEALAAVLDEVAGQIERVARTAGDAAGDDPAARVLASVGAFVRLVQEDPRKGRVAIIEAGAVASLRGRRTMLLRHFAHRTATDGAALAGPGRRPPGAHDGEIAGLLFVGGMAELVTAWLDGALEASPEEIVAAATRMLLAFYAWDGAWPAAGSTRPDGLDRRVRPGGCETADMATTALGGTPVHTVGELPAVGSTAPGFTLTGADFSEVSLQSGTRTILNIFPSVDTGVCAASVKRFNELAAGLDDTTVVCVSADLPFAQARFCGAEGIEGVSAASSFKSGFGTDYGVTLTDGAFEGLLARAVVVIDRDGTVSHTQLVAEIGTEPDYDAAVAALG